MKKIIGIIVAFLVIPFVFAQEFEIGGMEEEIEEESEDVEV